LLASRVRKYDDHDIDDFVHYIVDAVKRMSALLSDLLAYSQASDRPPDTSHAVQLNGVIAGVVMNLSTSISESRAEITHDNLPEVYADYVQLTQVFQNLISNAIKCRSSAEPRIHVSAEDVGDQWRIGVRDNGIGIAPEYHDQVFGIFKRLHGKDFPGTGMGLAICKKIIERHGGRIWLESWPGKGSSFYFTLPK
jgi:light-regulated signal transduction histidine kinase (bacteriophytochrome)